MYCLLSPALIVKDLPASPAIEVMPVSVLLNPYFIPLASLLAIRLSPLRKLSVSLAPIVMPAEPAPSALAVNSCFVFKSLMPSFSFQAFALSVSIFEASF